MSKFINKVAFIVSESITFNHLKNIIEYMPNGTFDIIQANGVTFKSQFSLKALLRNFYNKIRSVVRSFIFITSGGYFNKKKTVSLEDSLKKIQKKFDLFDFKEAVNDKMCYASSICVFPESTGILYGKDGEKTFGIQQISKKCNRAMFILGTGEYIFNPETNSVFDKIFCAGNWQKEYYDSLQLKADIIPTGTPRFDKPLPKVDLDSLEQRYGFDKNKKTILWLPTHGRKTCSVLPFLDAVKQLKNAFNIIISMPSSSPEGCYGDFPFLNIRIKKKIKNAIIINHLESSNLLNIADYVFCDYGGSAFAAIYHDKNVILLNATDDRYAKKHIGENSAEMLIRKEIINFYPHQYKEFLTSINSPSIWIEQKEIRKKIKESFFTINSQPAGKIIAEILCKDLVSVAN